MSFESGYYPAGTQYDSRAPWNEVEARMVECPECEGTGFSAFYNEDGDRIGAKEYFFLPNDERHEDICEYCNGEGEIENDYEPDYERYDE